MFCMFLYSGLGPRTLSHAIYYFFITFSSVLLSLERMSETRDQAEWNSKFGLHNIANKADSDSDLGMLTVNDWVDN